MKWLLFLTWTVQCKAGIIASRPLHMTGTNETRQLPPNPRESDAFPAEPRMRHSGLTEDRLEGV